MSVYHTGYVSLGCPVWVIAQVWTTGEFRRRAERGGRLGAITIHSTCQDSQPALPIDMNKALAVAESSTLGLLALITGASPPEVVRELLLPPLDFDMPVPIAQTNSEPSTMRSPPHHFQTLPADPALLRNGGKTPPSAGPGAYDSTVIPPSHHARTLVLCFDGTGDQFDSDVCPHLYSRMASSPSRVSLRRTRTSCSSSRCSRRMTRANRWYTIRSAEGFTFIM